MRFLQPRMPLHTSLFAFLLLFSLLSAQPIRPNGKDKEALEPVEPSSPIFKKRENSGCNKEFRSYEGTCTSFGTKAKKLWGSTNRPHFSYFNGRTSTEPVGTWLPSPRLISNVLCRQSNDVFDERYLNEFTVFFGQFVDHTIVATTMNEEEPMPINIPHDDAVFGNFSKGQFPFFRSRRVRVREADMEQRAQNTLTSAVDLVSVYGATEERSKYLRTGKDGLMKTSSGSMLPTNAAGLNNAPRAGAEFFLAGDHRANEHPVLTALHTLLMREHNSIAKELKKKFPKWTDERLFQTARKINGGQMQKIVFEEWYPSITGTSLPQYKGFKNSVDPTVSIEFSTAAFRVGHTMVGNRVNRRGKNNMSLPAFSLKSMFFQTVPVMKSHGIEEFIRGALQSRAQKIDLKVRDALRNFLFTGVQGEIGLDLIAMNLQRGRDHGLPTYNAIRVRFGLSKIYSFSQISSNPNVQSALQSVYRSAVDVEAWVGLVAEDHVPGSSMGRTMLEAWKREFLRLRDGDSFYYRASGVFPDWLREAVPRVQELFTGEDCMRAILLRNTDISERELPERIFFRR